MDWARERLTRFRVLLAVATLVCLVLFAASIGLQLFVGLTLAGLTLGGIFAISGLGIVITYRATGVFNFAHGAMAVFVAYVLWQGVQVNGIPLWFMAPLALLVVGPALGAVTDRLVFRPLSERKASTAEKLVATVGVFVLLIGTISAIWGFDTKRNPVELFGSGGLRIGSEEGLRLTLGYDQAGTLGVVVLASVLLYVLFQRSRLGLDIKAVVDRRDLAQLTSVNANRVSMVSWAIGAGFAGITGVLLAPAAAGSLNPFQLTLLVIETFAVAIVAYLASFPMAILAGLAIGIGASYLVMFSFTQPVLWAHQALDFLWPGALPEPDGLAAGVANVLDPLITSMPVVVLLVALLVSRRMADLGSDEGESFTARIARSTAGASTGVGRALVVLAIATFAFALPWIIGDDLSLFRNAHQMVALAVVFLSIVVVTGFSGHITLAQAGFAGLGALVSARAHNAGLPVILAMLVGGLACLPVGFLAGYPALKRRGLFLGLTTLAVGLVLERAVFQNLFFVGDASATTFSDPTLFGLDLGGDHAFYFYSVTVLVLLILLARNLRTGRLGRILSAMRDSDTAASAIGINLRVYKLFVFSVGAFMAGIGGSLFSQAAGTFSGFDFITLNSLLWFAVVVVAGVTSIYGALLGAFLFVLLGSMIGDEGVSTLIIGLAAVSLGKLPGGLVGVAQRMVNGSLIEGLLARVTAPAPQPTRTSRAVHLSTTDVDPSRLRPSTTAQALLRRNGSSPIGRTEDTAHSQQEVRR